MTSLNFQLLKWQQEVFNISGLVSPSVNSEQIYDVSDVNFTERETDDG